MSKVTATEKTTTEKTGCGCGCSGTPTVDSCCELICFERPNYFCGHLLSDEDLRLEQRYAREKRKLYHRTLDGCGIVCGLRLTCDPNCDGAIRVGEGFAIDDCGNDLVVCASQRLDVIALLREKGWLLEEPRPDPCKPDEEPPDCRVKQCFYVTACYHEEPSDFTTPFVSGCQPQLSGCEPTRVSEGVRLDLLDELPEDGGFLGDLTKRMIACFKVFSEGQFAQALKEGAGTVSEAVSGQALLDRHKEYFDLFCRLRGLFLLHLQQHPSHYHCNLDDELRAIPFPHQVPSTESGIDKYRQGVADAFCELLQRIWQYVIDCAFGELVVPCPEVCKASCVVLGTVEVEYGRVVRVCNCPRDYVWSFAHFFEVLLGSVFGQLGCQSETREDGERTTCCRTFEVDCKDLLRQLSVDKRAFEKASLHSIEAIQAVQRSARYGFDFTRADAYSPSIFENMSPDEIRAAAQKLDIERLEVVEASLAAEPPHLSQVVSRFGLAEFGHPLVVEQGESGVVSAFADRRPAVELPGDLIGSLEQRLKVAEEKSAEAFKELEVVRAELAEKSEELKVFRGEVGTFREEAESTHATLDTSAKKLGTEVKKLRTSSSKERKELSAELATVRADFETFSAQNRETIAALERRLDEVVGRGDAATGDEPAEGGSKKGGSSKKGGGK